MSLKIKLTVNYNDDGIYDADIMFKSFDQIFGLHLSLSTVGDINIDFNEFKENIEFLKKVLILYNGESRYVISFLDDKYVSISEEKEESSLTFSFYISSIYKENLIKVFKKIIETIEENKNKKDWSFKFEY